MSIVCVLALTASNSQERTTETTFPSSLLNRHSTKAPLSDFDRLTLFLKHFFLSLSMAVIYVSNELNKRIYINHEHRGVKSVRHIVTVIT